MIRIECWLKIDMPGFSGMFNANNIAELGRALGIPDDLISDELPERSSTVLERQFSILANEFGANELARALSVSSKSE